MATAFFDGTIGIHSIQSTNEPGAAQDSAPQHNGADIFDVPGTSRSAQGATFSLKQPPKWLRRPTSCSLGFGGQLTSVSNLMNAQGKAQSGVVHIRKVTTEPDIIERATKLQEAIQSESLHAFAEGRTEDVTVSDTWKALLSLFKADSRDELVTLLGFSKDEVAARVAEAVENLKVASFKSHEQIDEFSDGKQREPVVSFIEPKDQEAEDSDGDAPGSGTTDKSETSAEATSDAASAAPLDAESTTSVPSLFGDDLGPGTPQEDFFNTIVQDGSNPHTVTIPHMNYAVDSSVAATMGSRASSVSSETLKNTFKIYPAEESEADRLVTKALVLGDFESAVSLCLSSDRFADAILLAVRGGPELLQRTQKAYFERRTTTLPCLRLFQSIVSHDLSDIVQNADLQEWREIFVVLCTFAKDAEFSSLAEQLGARLELQSVVSANEQMDYQANDLAAEFRRNATLTYLAAARLERLVNIWNEEMCEEEKSTIDSGDGQGSRYSAHVHALQTFIEKVTVFRAATKYVDEDLGQKNVQGMDGDILEAYKLSSLYDRYFEYAEMLATQGLVKEAAEFIKLTPTNYRVKGERERLLRAAGVKPSFVAVAPTVGAAAALTTSATASAVRTNIGSYSGYPTFTNTVPQPVQTTYSNYNHSVPVQATAATAAAPQYTQSHYVPTAQMQAQQPTATGYGGPQASHPASLPPPPQRGAPAQPPPPPKKRDNTGWNDAPILQNSRAAANVNLNRPNAITSPFPNATPSPGYVSPTLSAYGGQVANPPLPPPPRPSSVQQQQQQRVMPPPPPQAGQRVQPPPPGPPGQHQHHGTGYPPIKRPTSTSGVPQRQPTPSQYGPPPTRAPVGQTPPPPPPQMGRGPIGASPPHGQGPPGPGMYNRGTPSPAQFGPGPSVSQPPPQHPPGPYAPPPQQQMQRTAPPPLGGQHGPGQHPAGQSLLPPQPPTPLQSPQGPPGQGGPARAGPISRAPSGPPPPKYRELELLLSFS